MSSCETMTMSNGEEKDRGRKVRKKMTRKEAVLNSAAKSVVLHARQNSSETQNEDGGVGGRSMSNRLNGILPKQTNEQVCDFLSNGDATCGTSAFVAPRSLSPSDFAKYQFFDDLPLAPKDEEFKVVQRKKKNKGMQSTDKLQRGGSAEDSAPDLDQCKGLFERRVFSRTQTDGSSTQEPESFGSFSNSVSVSTFDSQSSSIRSASPVNSWQHDYVEADGSYTPTLGVDALGLSNDFISRIGSDTSLELASAMNILMNERLTNGCLLEFVRSDVKLLLKDELYASDTADGEVLHRTDALVSNLEYPDIVTSTISEPLASTSLETSRRNLTRAHDAALPQRGDIDVAGSGWSDALTNDGTLNIFSKRLGQSSEIVFGDFASSELSPQDKNSSNSRSSAPQIVFDVDARESTTQPCIEKNFSAKSCSSTVAAATSHLGACSNPVIFVDGAVGAACDLDISFGFDSDDDCCSVVSVKTGSCLPDVVDPAVVSCDIGVVDFKSSLGHFEFIGTEPLRNDPTASVLPGVDCVLPLPAEHFLSLTNASDCNAATVPFQQQQLLRLDEEPADLRQMSYPFDEKMIRSTEERRSCDIYQANNEDACLDRLCPLPVVETLPQKPASLGRRQRCRGEFDLRAAQLFLWSSYEEALGQIDAGGTEFLQCD